MARIKCSNDIVVEEKICGVGQHDMLLDNNVWRGVRQTGHMYPDIQLRVYKKETVSFYPFLLVDETGWDGHRECDDKVVALFKHDYDAECCLHALCDAAEHA